MTVSVTGAPQPVRSLQEARVTHTAPRPQGLPALSRPPRDRFLLVLTALLVTAPAILVLAISLGSVHVPPGEVWSVLLHHVLGTDTSASAVTDQIVWGVRTPRVLLAFVVGAGLAVAGAVLQAVVRNPLADPYVLGVSSGAALASVAALTLGGVSQSGGQGRFGVPAAAFAGALITLVLVVLLGRRQGRLDPLRLLLVGVALSYLLQAGTSYLQLTAGPNQLQALLFWLLGTVSGADWDDLGLPSAVVALCTAWLVLQGRGLNALLAGDGVAASLGVDVHRLRLQLLVVSAALTAVVISVAGGVGFVGLVAPHCVRLLIGSEHRRLLPVAALLGGVFLVVADLVGRTAASPLELPLNVVTAVAGVPFFLYLVHRAGRVPR